MKRSTDVIYFEWSYIYELDLVKLNETIISLPLSSVSWGRSSRNYRIVFFRSRLVLNSCSWLSTYPWSFHCASVSTFITFVSLCPTCTSLVFRFLVFSFRAFAFTRIICLLELALSTAQFLAAMRFFSASCLWHCSSFITEILPFFAALQRASASTSPLPI